jgi:hypothetical protein
LAKLWFAFGLGRQAPVTGSVREIFAKSLEAMVGHCRLVMLYAPDLPLASHECTAGFDGSVHCQERPKC